MSAKSKDERLSAVCSELLQLIGEDPKREGLLKTPQRYAQAVQDLTVGYSQNVEEIVGEAIFKEDYSEMVIVKNIEFYSLCEHHLLPFFGYAHVAYVPNGKIIGLSKIPRIVNMFARRLQVQERLTGQISHALFDLLKPQGVGVIIEASHMCMMMRGTQVQASRMITNSLLGEFLKDPATRDEFFKMVAPRNN